MIKCTLIEAITVCVLILMSFLLECIKGQQVSTDKIPDEIEWSLLHDKLNLTSGNSSSSCMCSERSKCLHSPPNSQGIGIISPRFGKDNFCKQPFVYCCPVIHGDKSSTAVDTFTKGKDEYPPPQTLKNCGIRVPGGSGGNQFPLGEAARSAGFGEFPWTAVILTLEDGLKYFKCGASLIHSQAVLTAASCVVNQEFTYLVRLGEYNPSTEDETLSHVDVLISYVKYHSEYYSGAFSNDVAVGILKESVDFKPHIQPICLPTQDEKVENEKDCYISGWGTDLEKIVPIFTTVLESVTLDIVPRDVCEQSLRNSRLGPKFKLGPSFICAGGTGADSCLGDGGGPLICKISGERRRYRQVGIVSWGIGCGKYPGVYTNVASYVDWINQQLKIHNLTYSPTFYEETNFFINKFQTKV